jgi:hypothetical protein
MRAFLPALRAWPAALFAELPLARWWSANTRVTSRRSALVSSGQRLRMRSMMAEAVAAWRGARAKRKSKPPMARGMDGCNDKKSTTPLSLTQKR